MASSKVVSQGLFMLSEIIDFNEITETTVKVWCIGLRRYSDTEVRFAFDYLIERICLEDVKYTKEKVKPGDIVKIIDETISQGWSEAWQECKENAHKVGALEYWGGKYHKFEFSSPLVEKAFERFGGKSAFVGLPLNDGTQRAQFRDIYKEVSEERRKESKLKSVGMSAGDGTIKPLQDPVKMLEKSFDLRMID